MKVTLQTTTGIQVNVQHARFQFVRAQIGGKSGKAESVPAAWAGPNLMENIRRMGQVSTTSAMLRLGSGTMGVLYAVGGGNLAALLFDLSEPDIQAWLSEAKRAGNLPIVFQCGDAAKLVRVPVDADIVDLADRATSCVPATRDELVMAMQAVVGQFDDSELLAAWGIDFAALTQGSVSLLTPTAALGGRTTSHH